MIKVSPHGILGIYPLAKYDFLLQLSSGEIEVFNLNRSKPTFKVEVAHTD
jgi:hypothetical protein